MKCTVFLVVPFLHVQASNYLRRSLQQESFSVDFSGYAAGDVITKLEPGGITVSSKKRMYSKTGPLVDAQAMIFDSSNPTGGDEDLGSPNVAFGGPGRGKAGGEGSDVANTESQGMVLIISEDDNSNDPDDAARGGYIQFDFAKPMRLRDIGLLDNEENTRFDVVTATGETIEIEAGQGGDNSLETIAFADYGGDVLAAQLKVTFGGSGAITHLKLYPSSAPVPTLAPVANPVPTLAPVTTAAAKVCQVAVFVLWDAELNAPMFPIDDGAEYCREELPDDLTIEALTDDCVDYVKIELRGPVQLSRVEGAYPYIVSGDRRGDVNPIKGFSEGDYVCSAFPDGNRKLKKSVSFSVKSCPYLTR